MTTEEPEQTCSHEEFWVFSQVSQWGSQWVYSSDDHLNSVRSIMMRIRSIGIKKNIPPRVVHYAQILLWRFYIKENPNKYPFQDIIPLAFESASLLLETSSYKDIVSIGIARDQKNEKMTDLKLHFTLVLKLDYSLRIHHPSEYLQEFFTQQATDKQIQLAECIISDSYLCPCCLVHKPERIAEGAALMAAGMTNSPQAAIAKSQEALSFIKDMQFFYTHSIERKQ